VLFGADLREDMYKVIVERPRRGKEGDATAARLRKDFDGPTRLGMRAGYGYRSLNENLAPLRRYLHAQIGRPWNKVFGEICTGIDRRNTVQQHIHQHIRDFIAIDVDVRGGQLIDLVARWGFRGSGSGISQGLYVDPRTVLIRPNKNYRPWRLGIAEHRRREQAEIAVRRRKVDERTYLLLLNEIWFSVEVDVLPDKRRVDRVIDGKLHRQMTAESRYDMVLRKNVSRTGRAGSRQREYLYGSSDLYAVNKRRTLTNVARCSPQ
jgi:hypothetical protein